MTGLHQNVSQSLAFGSLRHALNVSRSRLPQQERVLRSEDSKCGTVWKRCFHILFPMASTNMTTVMSSVFWIVLSLENIHQRSAHETLEAHGKMLSCIVRKTTLLLNQLGSAKNEERTFKLEDGAAADDERKGSWQRTRKLSCNACWIVLRCSKKGTARQRVTHEKATQIQG